MISFPSFRPLLYLGLAVSILGAGPATAANTSTSSTAPSLWDGAYDWSGPYVGGFIGGTWSYFRNNAGTSGPSGSDRSLMGGGDIGNNWQFGHAVIGAEADFSKLDNHSGSGGIKFDEDWMSTARLRAGYSIGRFLPYVTGGLALTDAVSKVSGVGSADRLRPGYAAGGGVDALLSGNWFARIEYLRTDVPKYSSTIGGTTITGGSGNDTVRVGLNYKF